MEKSIEQLINSRKLLSNEQLLSLHDLLTYQQRSEVKIKVKSLLFNKFFTAFEGKSFTRQFIVEGNSVSFKPIVPANRKKELQTIRNYILLEV